MAVDDKERAKAIEAALAQIDKQFGKGSIMRLGSRDKVDVPAIPTGSLSLDAALGVGGVPRGRVIEEITRTGSGEQRPTERVTLVEFSEATLDPSIFAVPQTYRPALRRLRGGFDLARTDTIANRLRDYLEELASWAHDYVRSGWQP